MGLVKRSSTLTIITLFALAAQVMASSVTDQFDTAHQQTRRGIRGRHANLAERVEKRQTEITTGACTLGAWRCQAQSLERCFDNKWNAVETCKGETICSEGATGTPPGCVWKDSHGATVPSVAGAPTLSVDIVNHNLAASAPPVVSPVVPPIVSPVVPPVVSSVGPGTTSIVAPSVTGVVPPVPSAGGGGGNVSYSKGTFSAPHVVSYVERPIDVTPWPKAADLLPINRFLVSFWVTVGDVGNWSRLPLEWLKLSAAERTAIMEDYHSHGIALMLSAFGGVNFPTTLGAEPIATATAIAQAVKENGFDGVDVNYEDSIAFELGTGAPWLIAFQGKLRELLPPPYLISHAPQPPHFVKSMYKDGAYAAVHAAVGTGIDWYNMQYYNQGANNPFTTCESIIDSHLGMAMLEIVNNCNMPPEKLVLGKPPVQADAYNTGLVTSDLLATCIKDMKGKGLTGGMMVWQYGKSYTQEFCKAAMAGYS